MSEICIECLLQLIKTGLFVQQTESGADQPVRISGVVRTTLIGYIIG